MVNLMYRFPLVVVCLSDGIPHSLTPFTESGEIKAREGREECTITKSVDGGLVMKSK